MKLYLLFILTILPLYAQENPQYILRQMVFEYNKVSEQKGILYSQLNDLQSQHRRLKDDPFARSKSRPLERRMVEIAAEITRLRETQTKMHEYMKRYAEIHGLDLREYFRHKQA